MQQPTFRQRLALRLEGYPLLRTLVLDTAFFWAVMLIAVVVIGLGVGIPKVWRTTPENFSRATIRVSLIDLVQAWSLSRAARRSDAVGEYDRAMLALRGAVVNNLGDPNLHRAMLRHLRDVPEARPDQAILALFSSSWLLALSQTNITDLELSSDVLEKYGLPAYALEILGEAAQGNDPSLSPVRARCLFAAGRVEEFLSLWRTHPEWGKEMRMRLYHDAWQAGWDSGVVAIDALQRLRDSVGLPGNDGLTAARLLLVAAVRKGGPADAAVGIERLQASHAASVAQHALYWRFLASVGEFDQARAKAKAYGGEPRLAMEAAAYAEALAALGLRDEAIDYLEKNLPKFQTHPAVWEAYLSILVDARRWNDVRRAAAEAQRQAASFETTRILAMFAQYRAEVGENREHTADGIADKLASARILDNGTALTIARSLMRDGRAAPALKILQAKRPDLRDEKVYWQAVFSAALSVHDVEALRESSIELLRLAPNDPVALSNRAAMLIAVEQEPAEALEITFRLVTEYPHVAAFQINHAFALLLNRRVEEAWGILGGVDANRLDRQAASAYHLAMTEALNARGEFREALAESDKVQPGLILPPQAERLERLRRELRTRTGS